MKKQDLILLGKVFESEISGHVSFQSKRFLALEERGLVSFTEQAIDLKDGLPPLTVNGWVLTQKGYLEYCSNCEKYCPEDSSEDL